MNKSVGIIGIGDMGTPIARNLLDAGYTVYGFDLNPEKLKWLRSAGGAPCVDMEELADKAEVVLTCLPSNEAFIKAAGELAEFTKPGQYLVEMGTTAVFEMRKVAQSFAERGIEVIDAPMSNGPRGVEQRKLQIFVGCKRETYDSFRPMFQAIGGEDQVYYCGESGFGQVAKAVNQLCMGLTNAVAIEILSLAHHEGLGFELISEMFGKKFPILGGPIAVINQGGHPEVKYRELPYYISNAREAGYELPITRQVYEYMKDGELVTIDDHRNAPSFYHELTKPSRAAGFVEMA